MRKEFFLMALLVLAIDSLHAQRNNTNLSDKIKVTSIVDMSITRAISEKFESITAEHAIAIRNFTGIPSFTKQDFDFVNLYQGRVEDEKGIAFVAPYKWGTGYVSFAFAIFRNQSGYIKPMLVKTFPDKSSLTFYDLEEGTALTIERNGKSFLQKSKSIDFRPLAKGKGCGQAVNNCISDVYTNHGWVSVWASFQSIFLPATSVAIIAACIVKNCS